MRKILSLAVFLACAFFIYSYIRSHLADFSIISGISLPYVLLIGCADIAYMVVNGLFVKVVTGSFAIDLHFSEYFSISVMTSFGNLFLPMRGGAGIKAVYLKSRYGFDYSYFLSGLGANYLVVSNCTAVAALAGLGLLYARTGALSIPVTLVFLAIAVMSLWAILLSPPGLAWVPIGWARERLELVMSGWRIIRKNKRTVLRLYCLAVLNLFFVLVVVWLEFCAFHMKDVHGNSIGFLQTTIFSAIVNLSVLISVTPSALGIRETMLMFCSRFLGITPAQALVVTLLDRTLIAVLILLLFGFASVHINRRLKSANSRGLSGEGR